MGTLRLAEPHDPTPSYGDGDGLLQAVGPSRKKYQAQVASLRLDCHLLIARKAAFLVALAALCEQFGLDVLYYLDHELPDQINLMLFFANGW